MAPRTYTNPAPQTEAARQQLGNFYCDLCGKGYARANEYANHETSYEHNHNKRRKELKSMSMGMQNAATSKKKKKDEEGIKPLENTPSEAAPVRKFKRVGGFRSLSAASTAAVEDKQEEGKEDKASEASSVTVGRDKGDKAEEEDEKQSGQDESDADDMEWEYYDPHKGTPCGPECEELHAGG